MMLDPRRRRAATVAIALLIGLTLLLSAVVPLLR